MKIKTIITISGRICSGKSYAANLIKTEFGLPVASFGSYLKHYCEVNSLPTDRKTLQDTGEAFIKENPNQFLENVLAHFIGSADNIVLEGVRHKSILAAVDQITENHLAVFVYADLNTRYERYFNRNKESDELKTIKQFKISDSHPVELEIESLKQSCDISVDSSQEYSSELFAFLSSKLIS
jgi:cytidylate kinase